MVQRSTGIERVAFNNPSYSNKTVAYRVQPMGDGLFSCGAMTLYDGRHNKYFRGSNFSQFLFARRLEDGLLGEGNGNLQGIPQSILSEYGLNPRNATIVDDPSFSTGDHSDAGVCRVIVARGRDTKELVLKWNGGRLGHEIESYIQEIQSGNPTRELVMPFIAHTGNGRGLPAHLIYEYIDKPDIAKFLGGPDAPATRSAAIALYIKHMSPHISTWKHNKVIEGPIDNMTTALGLYIFDMQFLEWGDYLRRMDLIVKGISQIKGVRERRRQDVDENTFKKALADYPITLVYDDGKQRVLPSANEAKRRTSKVIGNMRTQRMLFASGVEGDIAGKNSYVEMAKKWPSVRTCSYGLPR